MGGATRLDSIPPTGFMDDSLVLFRQAEERPRLEAMLVSRRHAERYINTIEARLLQAISAGGGRSLPRVAPKRKANAAGSGLFLLRKPTAGAEMTSSNHSVQIADASPARQQIASERLGQAQYRRAEVVLMPDREKNARQQQILGLMAAMGPLVWMGHAGLVWLKVL